jgi:hypothetical protein
MGKITTAKRVLQNDGFLGIIRAFKEQYLDQDGATDLFMAGTLSLSASQSHSI